MKRVFASHTRHLVFLGALISLPLLSSCKKAAAGGGGGSMVSKENQGAVSPEVKSPVSPEDERQLSKMGRELDSLKTRISVIKAEINAYPKLDRPETSSDELRESLARSKNKAAYLKQTNARIDKQIKRYESEIASERK